MVNRDDFGKKLHSSATQVGYPFRRREEVARDEVGGGGNDWRDVIPRE
jgi:hypothetical protein